MIKELRFALYALKKNIQNNAELRTSFALNIFGMVINNTTFVLLWLFFVRSVGIINGWTTLDVVALQGFAALAFGMVFSVGAGIRRLPDYVATGSFDRFMLSPKNILIRVSTAAFGASAVGDVVFGIACLVIYVLLAHASLSQILLLVLLTVCSTAVFLGAVITVYSASFLFTDARSVTDGLFELFMTPSLFHGGAFQGPTRFFFIFVIPSLVIGTLPTEIVRDISLGKLALVAALALIWFPLSVKLFNAGVRRYESSNFMTFGQ
jgi:ABC-2 type transport system permease protein